MDEPRTPLDYRRPMRPQRRPRRGWVNELIPFLIAVSLVLSPLVIWLYLEALTYFRRSK